MNVEELSRVPAMPFRVAVQLIRTGEKTSNSRCLKEIIKLPKLAVRAISKSGKVTDFHFGLMVIISRSLTGRAQ